MPESRIRKTKTQGTNLGARPKRRRGLKAKFGRSSIMVALQELLSKGLLKLVSKYRAQVIYTRNTKGGDAPAAGEDAEQVPPTVHFEK
eukprot:bmy_09730T0